MQLALADEDARTLRDVIAACLPDLRREAAGTDIGARELRHALARREALCERLLADLDRRIERPDGASP